MNEQTLTCFVEQVGEIRWHGSHPTDERWNEPETVLRVLDSEGFRHVVTAQHAMRDGTVLSLCRVGMTGMIRFFGAHPAGFSCPRLGKAS